MFLGWKGIRVRLRWSSEVEKRHDFLCSSFLSSLLRFFDGKLSCGKYCGVCHVDAEKEQQCLAAGVACRYTTHIVVLFLIFETSLHNGGAQCTDNSSGRLCVFTLLGIAQTCNIDVIIFVAQQPSDMRAGVNKLCGEVRSVGLDMGTSYYGSTPFSDEM